MALHSSHLGRLNNACKSNELCVAPRPSQPLNRLQNVRGVQGPEVRAGASCSTLSSTFHVLPRQLRGALSIAKASSVHATTTGLSNPVDPKLHPVDRAVSRKQRLTKLVELRALYRDFVRARTLLRLQTPVYMPMSDDDNVPETDKEREIEEQDRKREAMEIVAEMQLTAERIKAGLRALAGGFGDVFMSSSSTKSAKEYEDKVRKTAQGYIVELRARVAQEIILLPYPSIAAAQAALDARNARFSRTYTPAAAAAGAATVDAASQPPAQTSVTPSTSSSASSSAASAAGSNGSSGGMNGSSSSNGSGISLPGSQEAAQQLANSIEKLGQAEKVAEQFVVTRIKPVLKKAREGELVDMFKETSDYLKGLWVRLNGGGSRMYEPALSPDLPLPVGTKKDIEVAISELSLEVDAIESKLREAARAREAKLRKMRAPEGRAAMPFQLKMMDEEVLKWSRCLAIRMLQMELEYAYSSLEDEALDIDSNNMDQLLRRQGSTGELRLLTAEFAFLDEQLSALASQLQTATAAGAAASSHGLSGAGGGGAEISNVVQVNGVPVSVEDLLVALATEVPDMRQRVGVADQVVFGGQGFTLTKARLQVRDALEKVKEGVMFLVRGVKLLGSDVSTATRLFGKAAVGGTLKPREVSALRRTALDVLTFIPFTIILIIPLTPLGHVLVFGFIQTYFPSFFPSCFTGKRQELMVRYEELEQQLLRARMEAEQVEEEAELVRAAAAKASRLSGNGAAFSDESAATSSMDFDYNSSGSTSAGGGGGGYGNYGNSKPRQISIAGGMHGDGSGTAASSSADEAKVLPASPLASQSRDGWPDLNSLDAAASAQTAQVKALEKRIAAVLDDVTLGDDPALAQAQAQEQSVSSSSIKKRIARKTG